MPQPFADELRSVQFSPKLSDSLERARVFAREQSHRAVLLEHLLLALTEDADAAAVMQACGVDPVRLGTDASGYLGRLLEDMRAPAGFEPRPDAELLRVLQAAGQAAQQSRRRQIDGAIVLAAIVGDGKSPAAGLLKAHGLTFEEAIRALQKATTAANAKARSQLYAAPAKPAAEAAGAGSPPAVSAEPQAPVAAAGDREEAASAAAGQSVDEILAAARARIQQRTAAMVAAKPEAKAPPEPSPAPPAEGGPLPLSALTSGTPQPPPSQEAEDPLKDLEAAPAAPPPPPPPQGPPQAPPARSSWTPPPGPQAAQQPPARMPPPPRPPSGPPDRQLAAAGGPPRPHPQGPRPPQGPPPPGYANRPQQAPWPGHGGPPPHPGGPAPHGPAANGALADAPLQAPARPRSGQRGGAQAGGPLVETIPRRMRVGKGAPAQVRIARDKIDGLIMLLMSGRGMAHRPDAFVTRALSVRLRAPDGGFAVEPGSPETQWVDSAAGLQHDEFVGWRWTVTPQRRGRGKLLLVVTARTVGRDGLATETAPPDRAIEVVVTGGRLRRLLRWAGLLLVLVLGMGLGRYGHGLWEVGMAALKRFTS